MRSRWGSDARLRFSGPGLTLLIGGVLALGVSYYATSRATRSRTRLRDIVRRRVLSAGMGRRSAHPGLFISVDGADPVVTAGYAALLDCRRPRTRAGAGADRRAERVASGAPGGRAAPRRRRERRAGDRGAAVRRRPGRARRDHDPSRAGPRRGRHLRPLPAQLARRARRWPRRRRRPHPQRQFVEHRRADARPHPGGGRPRRPGARRRRGRSRRRRGGGHAARGRRRRPRPVRAVSGAGARRSARTGGGPVAPAGRDPQRR